MHAELCRPISLIIYRHSQQLLRRMVERLVNDELERVWKEALVGYLKYIWRNFHGGTKENHEKPQSLLLVSCSRFEPSSSRIKV
jgi:hypothetical protein